MLPEKNTYVYIQSYKHDGTLHRTWAKGFVLDASEECITLVNNKTLVSESDGRKWYTREPAIWFFFPKLWFNVICMIRKSGVYYYCNLASPALFDQEAIKYIDYDLDVKVFPDGNVLYLDEDEYLEHKSVMQYPAEIDRIIRLSQKELVAKIDIQDFPFSDNRVLELYSTYQVSRSKGKYRS